MKAAVIRKAGRRVEVEDRERPTPGPDEILIRVHACGVCHGDLMVGDGQFPFARYPIVPGHEIAGTVEATGERVTHLARGARVGASALYSSCAVCRQCLGADEFLCGRLEFTGVTRDGGFQEYMLAQAAYVAPLPEGLDFAEAAPLMCARRLMGSPAGSRKDLRDTLAFAADHGVRPRVKQVPLQDLAGAFGEIDKGHMRGRAVVVMQ